MHRSDIERCDLFGGMDLRIRVPDGREPVGYVGFGAQLAAAGPADEYILDFGEVSFVSPGWMVSVGDALRKFRRDRAGSRRTAANYKGSPCLDYAARAGFCRSFGMGFGQPTGAVASTDSYIPVTVAEVEDIRMRAFEDFAQLGDVVQSDAEKMVAVLTQSTTGPVFETLSYAIREIVRNVVEHSQSGKYSFAAQFWPAAARVFRLADFLPEKAWLEAPVGVRRHDGTLFLRAMRDSRLVECLGRHAENHQRYRRLPC